MWRYRVPDAEVNGSGVGRWEWESGRWAGARRKDLREIGSEMMGGRGEGWTGRYRGQIGKR